jgi:hypothetical protein
MKGNYLSLVVVDKLNISFFIVIHIAQLFVRNMFVVTGVIEVNHAR